MAIKRQGVVFTALKREFAYDFESGFSVVATEAEYFGRAAVHLLVRGLPFSVQASYVLRGMEGRDFSWR